MLTEPEHVWTLPLASMTAAEREEFKNAGMSGELAPWPGLGSRMMTRVFTGQDMRDGWVIVQFGWVTPSLVSVTSRTSPTPPSSRIFFTRLNPDAET